MQMMKWLDGIITSIYEFEPNSGRLVMDKGSLFAVVLEFKIRQLATEQKRANKFFILFQF